MDNLVKMLKEIYGLLEQIYTITANQTTILLQSKEIIVATTYLFIVKYNLVCYWVREQVDVLPDTIR